jgi:dihydroorotase-like cyclic amidohydrolase
LDATLPAFLQRRDIAQIRQLLSEIELPELVQKRGELVLPPLVDGEAVLQEGRVGAQGDCATIGKLV